MYCFMTLSQLILEMVDIIISRLTFYSKYSNLKLLLGNFKTNFLYLIRYRKLFSKLLPNASKYVYYGDIKEICAFHFTICTFYFPIYILRKIVLKYNNPVPKVLKAYDLISYVYLTNVKIIWTQ